MQRLHSIVEGKYQSIAAQLDDQLRSDLMDVVQENAEAYFIELEDKFREVSEQAVLSFQVDRLELNSETVSVGLAQFEEERSKLEKRIEEQQEQLNQMEKMSVEARIAKRRLDECKEELASAQARMDTLQQTFVIPDPIERAREVENSYWRGGLLGWVGNALFGKKREGTRIETDLDTTAHDAAVEERDRVLEQIRGEIEEAKKRRTAVQGPDIDPEEAAFLVDQAQQKLEKLQKAYDDKVQQFNEKLDRRVKKMIQHLKEQVFNHLDEYAADFSREIHKYLDKQKSGYVGAVRDLLNANLDQELQRTSVKLEGLLQAIESDGDERRQRLEAITRALDELCSLLDQGAELSERLKAEMDDHIEQEAF